MSFDAEPCVGAAEHHPLPYATDRHHTHPKYLCHLLGVPERPETVPLCPTDHMNAHHCLVHLINSGTLGGHRPPTGVRAVVDTAWQWWQTTLAGTT